LPFRGSFFFSSFWVFFDWLIIAPILLDASAAPPIRAVLIAVLLDNVFILFVFKNFAKLNKNIETYKCEE
jgi:hypothetical protein